MGASIGTITNSGKILGDVEIDQAGVTVYGGAGSTFGDWTGGTITVGASGASLDFEGGNTLLEDNIVIGTPTDPGTVTNADPLRIDTPIAIAGNYIQTVAGTLDFVVTGASDYGSLDITGLATLDGWLAIDPIAGFRFTAGESFEFLTFNNILSDFGAFSLGQTACSARSGDVWSCGSVTFEEILGAKSLDVQVLSTVPEPSTWAMLIAGFVNLTGLAFRRRRRAAAA